MPIQIQVPGKGIAEFPDDVSYDDAFKAIQEDVPDFQPSRADMFAKLQRQSEAFAAPDRARFARQLGVTAEPSGFDYLASSAASAASKFSNFVPGAIGLVGGVQEGLGLGSQINERIRKPVEGFIEDTFPVDPETTTGIKGLLTTGVAGGAGQLLSSLMPGGVFKNAPKLANLASSLMGGAQEFTDAWDRERERQKQAGEDDPLKALIKSGGYAAIATALESKLGPGHLAEKLAELGKGKVNNIIASAFKNAAAGGAEEFLQRIAQNLIIDTTEVSKEDRNKPGFSWWKSVDVPSALGEGLVGAIVQGGAGTSIDAYHNHVTDQNTARRTAYYEWMANERRNREQLDSTREQSANELAEMAGFEKPHTGQRLPLPEPQRFTLPTPPQAQLPTAIESEAVLLKQAEDARQAGQISDQEYLAAVDRFQQARAVNLAQPPPLPAPQTPNLSGGESTNEGQIQEKGLQVAPAATPPPSSVAGEVVPEGVKMHVEEYPDGYRLGGIQVEKELQGRGLGTTAMQSLVAKSESTGKPIFLTASTTKDQQPRLNSFYERLGFVHYKNDPLSGKPMFRRDPTGSSQVSNQTIALESNPPDRIDAALSRAIEATNPFGKANTGNLGVTYTVLLGVRAAYRAGKSLANAIKESIAQYRTANPSAQFNDEEVDAAVRIKLQDFLAGGEDALAIAKASEPAVAENERAAAMIHSEEYYRQRVRDKETELKKIRDDTLQAALGRGVDPSMVPGHMDEELANIADGVGLDAALITQLQTEVRSEKKAFALSKLQGESEEINRTIDKLAKLDPEKNVQIVEDLLKRKESVDKEIADEKFDDVRIRAAFILDFQREYVSRKARLEALNNPDVKEAISGPVQVLRDLMAEYPDIRDRGVSDWVSDPNITDEVKRVVVARLSTAFREFDKHHDNVATTLAASEASLERQINRLKERISRGEIRKAYINIVIEEARLALAGEEGLTGGRGAAYLEWFDANTEALRSFARSIAEKIDGTGQSALDARKLADWLIFSPSSAPPAIVNSARENWGVGDETLREIMKALQESEATRNAVAAIFDKGSETIPAHTLQRIAELANTGEESDTDEAEKLSKSLQKKQGTERAKVIQRLRTDAKNLLDARVRLETLREALKLFQSVEASPVFKDARIETETQEGSFTRQMFVNDEVKMLLRGFESPGASHPEVQIGAASGGDQFFDKNTKSAIEGWRRSAGQYIAEYDAALLNSSVNPAAPHPISLGYDVAIYRGLKTALQESNILTDPSTYSDESKIDSWKGFTSLGQTAKFLQALDYTARMVEGVFGKNWQLKNARYRNAKLDAAKVFHNRENAKIPALLSKAMASHKMSGADWLKKIPKFGPWFDATFAPGGNVEVYRNLVFDQIAHMARGNFVGSPQVGDTLPSGEVITQADLDLLDQAIRYSNGLRRVAQENRGTLLDINEKQYRRPAASVGVKGLSRRIGGRGGDYVQRLASIDDPAGFDLSANDDLLNGTRPWIKFWNEHAITSDALTRHTLDSVRGDRAITVSPYMKKAYEGLAADLMVNKYANRISSLEDLVAKLSVHFPQGTGLSAREYVTSELGKELAQYAARAKVRVDVGARIAQAVSPTTTVQSQKNKKDTLQKSSSMIDTETMNNEFTKPAADLEFPSSWYEYGAITPLEMALAKDRSVGEATVELKHAIREAKGFVSSFISANRENKLMRDDVVRFESILGMINSIDEDVGVDYQPQRNMAYRALKKSGGLAVGGALTTVVGAAGNVLSSAYPVYIYHSRVNNVSRAMSAALALVHIGRATKNLAYVFVDKAVGGYASSAFKALAKSKNPKMVKVADTLTDWLDRSMKWAGFSAMVDVKDLGLSQTDRFLTEVANDFRSSLQYMDNVEEMKYSGVGGKALMAARAAGSAIETSIKNFNKQIGLEMGDLAVNMAAYQIALAEERDLKKMAVKWASERVQKLGAFDESKPEWQARPDEWQGGYFQTKHAENEKLAGLRMQMSESGLQLENALWDYWNRSEGGKKDVEFFKDPDSFRRTTIGAINANIFTNRPQKAQTNPDQGMFQTLLNYSSNLLVQILSAFKSVKSAKGMRKWFDIIMRAVWGAIAALLVGLATSAGREVVGRNLTSRIDRRMTSYDKEFWTPDSKLPLRLAMVAMAVQPFGQSVVNIASMNRPDFASGNFYIGFINMLATYVQGATRAQVQDIPWLVDKFLHGIFKFLDVTDNMGVNATKQLNAGLASAASAVHAAGLESQAVKSGASGFQFTEKTPILAKINEAGMRAQIAREKGDETGLQAALADIAKEKDRLVKYHKDALVEDNKRRGVTMTDFKVDQESIAAARKDWLSLNPLTKALGHQPTSTEMERISAYLSGDRKAAFDRAWNSYSGLAEFFPNGKGVANEPEMVKQERIAGLGRSSGGLTGGMSAGSLSASLRGGGGSVGVRRFGLRSRRGGISRLSRGVRSRRRSRGRIRGVRRIRFR